VNQRLSEIYDSYQKIETHLLKNNQFYHDLADLLRDFTTRVAVIVKYEKKKKKKKKYYFHIFFFASSLPPNDSE
jgi:hypothetical protein